MQCNTSLAALAATALLAFGSAASAQTGISVNFGTDQDASTLASTSAAGVVPLTNFNNESGGTGTGPALVDSTGAATTATLTYLANNGTFHTGQSPSAGPNQTLLTGYIDTESAAENPGNPTTTVTLTNIPYATYSVYVYTATNCSAYPDTRTDTYTITGAATGNQTQTNVQPRGDEFANGFVQGQNYLLFSGLSGSSFLLSTSAVSAADNPGDAGFLRSGIDGIQIVPTAAPEPSQTAALGLGILGLGALALRARRRASA
jgi:hypothetical protein